MRYLPPVTSAVFIGRLLTGRVAFPRGSVGKVLSMDNGEEHRIFREVKVTSSRSVPVESMTVLKVRFKFARFSPELNQRLSLIPVPAIAGMPGFRQKTWTFCEGNGYSQGIYQFESPEQAVDYINSLVMRVLERRSLPMSAVHELYSGCRIEDYLAERFRG